MLKRLISFWAQHQVGLYTTLIFHLLLGILLMGVKLGNTPRPFDFEIELDLAPAPEEPKPTPQQEKLAQERKAFEQELNQMLSQSRNHVRNAAVDQNASTNTTRDPDNVMQAHDDLQRRIAETHRMLQDETTGDVPLANNKPTQDGKQPVYSGPSVTAYNLPGRKAHALPVPAYMCQEGGKVVVSIMVDQRGRVVSALVDQAQSAPHECLQSAAKEAALRSRFNVGSSPKNETGSISYLFVPQ